MLRNRYFMYEGDLYLLSEMNFGSDTGILKKVYPDYYPSSNENNIKLISLSLRFIFEELHETYLWN
jgi:hypothetical protein